MEVRYFVKERLTDGGQDYERYPEDHPEGGFVDLNAAHNWAWGVFSFYPESDYYITQERV